MSQYVNFTNSRLAYAGGLLGSTSDYRPQDIPVVLFLGGSGILSVDFSRQQHSTTKQNALLLLVNFVSIRPKGHVSPWDLLTYRHSLLSLLAKIKCIYIA